jgi:Raf kinase inhibitor-like YbhB/YbcL family protein
VKLASPAFGDNELIPWRYTRDGDNLHPPLTISGLPEAARSLLLVVEDVDSPIGLFTHWLIWNLPPDTSEISEGRLQDNVCVGMNSFGEVRYDGPCPPSGCHRYVFRLLALDKTLDAETGDRRDQVMRQVKDHSLAEARLTGRFEVD